MKICLVAASLMAFFVSSALAAEEFYGAESQDGELQDFE